MEGGPHESRFPHRILQAMAHDEFGKAAATVFGRRGDEGKVEDTIVRHSEGRRRHRMAALIRDVAI